MEGLHHGESLAELGLEGAVLMLEIVGESAGGGAEPGMISEPYGTIEQMPVLVRQALYRREDLAEFFRSHLSKVPGARISDAESARIVTYGKWRIALSRV
jgi:hypothetical protein